MNSPFRKPALVIPKKATREDLTAMLDSLVEKGIVSVEAINEALSAQLEETHSAVAGASKVEGEEVKELSPEQTEKLFITLKARFKSHMYRHKDLQWTQVAKRFQEASPEKLWSLNEMERTGGEPDVVAVDENTGEIIFEDRSVESPSGRRNVVYDKAAEDYLKKNYHREKCNGNAVDMAANMDTEILDEARYRKAQEEEYQNGIKMDYNTWSFINTPTDIRKNGDALYGRRSDGGVQVDRYFARDHSSYGGFRASLRI